MLKRSLQTTCTIAVFVLLLGVSFLAGCSSKSVSDEVPQGTTVSVTTSPSQIENGQTTVVEATVSNGGIGLENQVVTFTAEPTTAGFFSPATDTTDASGIAATVFTATSTGSATIRVTVAGTSFNGTSSVQVNSTGQSGNGNIQITVTPSLLLANNSDTSVVAITVRDAAGNVAPDNTLIKITAGEKFVDVDGNGYWSNGIDTLVFDANGNGFWDAIGLIPSTATVSGGAGGATVNYISGPDAMTIYIKVTVNDNGIVSSAESQIQLSPNASINSIFLSADSINLVVKQTGGIETSLLRATGYDQNGNAVPEGLTINFIITDGPGGGEHFSNVGLGPYVAVTNSQGIATAPIHSGTISGTIRIRAYADTVLSNATQIMVSAGPPAYITIGAEKCNVDWWDDVAEILGVSAVVSDIYLNPVPDSTVVYFSTDEGTMKSHENRTKDLEGIANTKWISGTNVVTADGRVWIYCETAGGTVKDSSLFFNTHITDTLIVTGVPASMPADGTSKALVTVTGLDLNGNPVIGGTAFEAVANFLQVQGGSLDDGCYSSNDRVKITSVVLKTDNSMNGIADDGIGAVDIITYWSQAATSSYSITLTTGFAYLGNSRINGQASASLGEVITYNVTIADRFGNPLGDHSLVMTASGGTVSNGTQTTDSYGEANGFVWTAPGGAGSFTITVTDNDPRGGIVLTKRYCPNQDCDCRDLNGSRSVNIVWPSGNRPAAISVPINLS